MNVNVNVRWPLIVKEYERIYFNYIDLGNYTMFRMAIFKTNTPRLGLYVAIEDIGSFFFSTHKALHRDYVAEKLHLHGDASQVADFLNAQLQIACPQQGHYYLGVISEVRPHGRIGEERIMPWVPEIIGKA